MRAMFGMRAAALPEAITVALADGEQRIELRRNANARRYILRLPATGGDPVLTVPAKGTLATARDFAERQRDWLAAQLDRRPEAVAFTAGGLVPLRGEPHRIVAAGGLRGLVRVGEQAGEALLHVPGAEEHLSRRLTDWLKREAREDLRQAVDLHAGTLGHRYADITLRDTRSRWGSCTADGRLSFSWRLVLAPPFILDYVAAHEVAHLVEMNHGPRFWALCRRLAPRTEEARGWLRQEGGRLHLYG